MHSTTTELFLTDFSKFDTVNHELLLAKLDYNPSSSALSLMYSFLIGRSQRVLLRALFPPMSSFRNIPSSVAQGSVLEPLLFPIESIFYIYRQFSVCSS